MGLGGAGADEEFFGDLGVAVALGGEWEDQAFALSEGGEWIRVGGLRDQGVDGPLGQRRAESLSIGADFA